MTFRCLTTVLKSQAHFINNCIDLPYTTSLLDYVYLYVNSLFVSASCMKKYTLAQFIREPPPSRKLSIVSVHQVRFVVKTCSDLISKLNQYFPLDVTDHPSFFVSIIHVVF